MLSVIHVKIHMMPRTLHSTPGIALPFDAFQLEEQRNAKNVPTFYFKSALALYQKHEGALYKEVFPGKTKAHLSVTVDERGSNSKWRAI